MFVQTLFLKPEVMKKVILLLSFWSYSSILNGVLCKINFSCLLNVFKKLSWLLKFTLRVTHVKIFDFPAKRLAQNTHAPLFFFKKSLIALIFLPPNTLKKQVRAIYTCAVFLVILNWEQSTKYIFELCVLYFSGY